MDILINEVSHDPQLNHWISKKDTPCFCLQGDFYCQNESWQRRGKHFHRTQSLSIVGCPGIPATSLSSHLVTRTLVRSLDNFYARELKFLWLDDPNLDKNSHHSFSKLYNSVDSLVENISPERRIFLFCKVTVQTCWRMTHLLRSRKNDPHSFNGVLHWSRSSL